jgi:hypothetical protein
MTKQQKKLFPFFSIANKNAKVSGKLRQLLELTQGNERGKVFLYF